MTSDELKPSFLLATCHLSLVTVLMIIARIVGTVVSSQKDERLLGKKLLIVRPINLDGTDTSGYVVAVDTVGAGFHERVLVVAGSSARLAQGMKDVPVDAAIVGVIDTVDVMND
ncbi:MAG: hypothetical protein QOH63_4114 [Acidobacteriota bacterium]|nr:hypothetical protein [Acidobacteriota bacterium]